MWIDHTLFIHLSTDDLLIVSTLLIDNNGAMNIRVQGFV